MSIDVKTFEVTFEASTGYQVPMSEANPEEFLKDWIEETYPEFYDIVITETKEINK